MAYLNIYIYMKTNQSGAVRRKCLLQKSDSKFCICPSALHD